jgi:hypothetical protein
LVLDAVTGTSAVVTNISVRELPGNHAVQATAASRPIYGVVPQGGRRNIFTQTEAFNEAVWLKAETTVPATQFLAPDGTTTAESLIPTTVSGQHYAYVTVTTASALYTISLYAKANGYDFITLMDATVSQARTFNLSNGTKGGVAGQLAPVSDDIVSVGDGWYRCSITVSATAAAQSLRIYPYSADNPAVWSGNGTSGILLWGAQFETGSTATAYQRVTTQYDVTEAGVQSCSYLFFNGTNNSMTATLPAAISQPSTVFIGGQITNPSASIFQRFLDSGVGGGNRTAIGKQATATSAVFAGALLEYADDFAKGVYTASLNTTSSSARKNGTQRASGTVGSNPIGTLLIVGRSEASAEYLTGQIFSLIVRGAATTGTTINATEYWVGDKTGFSNWANIVSPTIFARDDTAVLDRFNQIIERRA